MTTKKLDIDQYIEAIADPERKAAIVKLRAVIKKNIPKGFEEYFAYGMPGFCVPHSIYSEGYHCDTKIPLPFVAFANQKNFVAIYHMGLYAMPDLMQWFTSEHAAIAKRKLDIGKSCIRYKKIDEIPYDLLGELLTKTTVKQWIEFYEKNYKR